MCRVATIVAGATGMVAYDGYGPFAARRGKSEPHSPVLSDGGFYKPVESDRIPMYWSRQNSSPTGSLNSAQAINNLISSTNF
jgi:hypothetical protein